MVKYINPNLNLAAHSFPQFTTMLGNKVIFRGCQDPTVVELWISDGTELGTHILKDITPGSGSSIPLILPKFVASYFFS